MKNSGSGGISGNPHSLLLRMLEDINLKTKTTYASSVLKVCVAYCSSLYSTDQYRRLVTVAMEMLALIPEEFTREIRAIEINLAKALRMSGEDARALSVFEKLLIAESSTEIRRNLLINIALCLQSLKNDKAILVAKEVMAMAPKSGDALQAKSIVLEMQDDHSSEEKLLQLERQSRRDGHNTVANNLTLNRITTHTDPSAVSTLRTVYESAKKANDLYNANRAATKIARFSCLLNGRIEQEDLKRLITAYHYFYGERFGSLFTNSHKALWDYFETVNEVHNQLVLFRHSSFVWRLNGHEDKEQNYLAALESKKNEVLLLGERIDKNVLYFLNRSEYQGNRLEHQSKKLGE